MRVALTITCCLLLAGVASADKVVTKVPIQPGRVACEMPFVTYDWDFTIGSHGFTTTDCDAMGGGSVTWEWGTTAYVAGAPGTVWGTTLNANYPNDAGHGLVSPAWVVDEESYLVEVHHYFDTETNFDGCNLVILPYGTVWDPIGGYSTTQISSSEVYYAWCVDMEPGWTGASGTWRVDCFDLSEFIGMAIAVEFDFGSDVSVNAPGWYISRVTVGGVGTEAVCCDLMTGECQLRYEYECLEMGGVWHPEWSSCDPNPCPQPCDLDVVTYDWDFADGPQDFGTIACDSGGMAAWQYGDTGFIPNPPGSVWGTVLNANYFNDSGDGLYSPLFTVTSSSNLVEVYHYFDIEYEYDGCNVCIGTGPGGTVLYPVAGYTVADISPSPSFYAYCVDGEPGWTGQSGAWRVDCFDLSAYMGTDIRIEFDFGSDASVFAPGWYLARVRVGGTATPEAACCDPLTGACTIVVEEVCASLGGVWHPEWTSCQVNPCPPPVPEDIALKIGDRFNPEPWNRWIGPTTENPDTVHVPLRLHLPDLGDDVTHVDFFWDSLGTWVLLGTDTDGTEPWFDTGGDATPVGDGWSLIAGLPIPIPSPPVVRFKAIAYTAGRVAHPFEGESQVDPAPPSFGQVSLQEWELTEDDTLGVEIEPGGAEIDSVIVCRMFLGEFFEKGVPGINQHVHSATHCAPTAVAQCLKYFEDTHGDYTITGGLSDHDLVDALAVHMATNQGPQPGTYLSHWIRGTAGWIRTHGDGYTLRAYPHFDRVGWTWVERDWRRMRNELQRCQDVLVGIFWDIGGGVYRGGHAMTFEAFVKDALPSGRIPVGFKDPWTGYTEWGELDTETGRIEYLSGAGGGGAARIGTTLIASPVEADPLGSGSGDLVYRGPNPYPEPIYVYLPDPGAWAVRVVVINTAGHAHRTTRMAIYQPAGAAPEEEHILPRAFRLESCLPNPFAAATEISYAVPNREHVNISIFDVTGRKVRTLIDRVAEPGIHGIQWDGRDARGRALPAAVYYVRMVTPASDHTRRITLLR